MPRPKITVEARTVYPRMGNGRKRKIYDAEGVLEGIPYCVLGAETKQDAIAQALAQVTFAKANPPIEALGFKLLPTHGDSFCLCFPSGGSCLFGASDRAAALNKLESEYTEHAAVLAFAATARSLL